MRTETLAIVFTDIKGYTAATSKQTHQEQAALLRRIERLVAPVVRAFSGRVIKSLGDAYMIVFHSPTEAVRAASAVQDRLHQHNTNIPADQGIHIRIAINVGEVRVHRGDVFGEPVNIASRIESVTPADEIYFSEAVYLTMNRSDVASERVGTYELKGIPEPVVVYRVKKFAQADDSEEAEGDGPIPAAGLPYGGTELAHWRRMRWVRRAYIAMWALAVVGLAGAAYLRYSRGTDYDDVVAAMKKAIEDNRPVDVISMAAPIPKSAVQAQRQARRYRRQAAEQLISKGELETATVQVNVLIKEDPRDAEALMLRGLLLTERGVSGADAVNDFAAALDLDPELRERGDLVAAVVRGYVDPASRKVADAIVENHLKELAIKPLSLTLKEDLGDRMAQNAMAARLDKLGARDEVDWVKLAIADLSSSSCKTRKAAIARLARLQDATAVGPLMKVADSKGCGAQSARAVANALLKTK